MGGGSTNPISPGGILNGVVTNIVAGGNPIKGAMLNASALFGSQGFGSTGVNPVSANSMIPGVQGGFGSLGGDTTALTGAPSGGGFPGADILGSAWQNVKEANQFMNENPFLAKVGMQAAGSLMQQQQPRQVQPGQISRGQIAPVDYMSLLNPQQQTVMRPATPSLI